MLTVDLQTDQLEALLYTSESSAVTGLIDLVGILEDARLRNQQRQITGLLLHDQGVFVQLLEGPADQLNTLWVSLSQDPRHHSIKLLDRRPLRKRRFGNWSMGFAGSDLIARHVPGLKMMLQSPVADLPLELVRLMRDLQSAECRD